MSEFSAIQKRYKYGFNFRPGVIKVAKNIKQKNITIYTHLSTYLSSSTFKTREVPLGGKFF